MLERHLHEGRKLVIVREKAMERRRPFFIRRQGPALCRSQGSLVCVHADSGISMNSSRRMEFTSPPTRLAGDGVPEDAGPGRSVVPYGRGTGEGRSAWRRLRAVVTGTENGIASGCGTPGVGPLRRAVRRSDDAGLCAGGHGALGFSQGHRQRRSGRGAAECRVVPAGLTHNSGRSRLKPLLQFRVTRSGNPRIVGAASAAIPPVSPRSSKPASSPATVATRSRRRRSNSCRSERQETRRAPTVRGPAVYLTRLEPPGTWRASIDFLLERSRRASIHAYDAQMKYIAIP